MKSPIVNAFDHRSILALADGALLESTKGAVARCNRVTAELLVHLGEADERRLYLAEGCSSMFGYCVQKLHLSESAAYKRIHAARVARRFPLIIERLAAGEIHLSGLRVLAVHLTEDNHRGLLDEVRHATKRQIEALVADRFQVMKAAPATRLRRLAVARPGAETTRSDPGNGDITGTVAPAEAAPQRADEAWRLFVTLGAGTREKLRQAQALLRHQIPDGDVDTILDRALELLLEETLASRFGIGNRARNGRLGKQAPGSRHVPLEVRRAVIARDGLRCSFVSENGQRCIEESFLELDHANPFALAGKSTVENVRVRCRAHNGFEADRVFGTAFMAKRRLGRKGAAL